MKSRIYSGWRIGLLFGVSIWFSLSLLIPEMGDKANSFSFFIPFLLGILFDLFVRFVRFTKSDVSRSSKGFALGWFLYVFGMLIIYLRFAIFSDLLSSSLILTFMMFVFPIPLIFVPAIVGFFIDLFSKKSSDKIEKGSKMDSSNSNGSSTETNKSSLAVKMGFWFLLLPAFLFAFGIYVSFIGEPAGIIFFGFFAILSLVPSFLIGYGLGKLIEKGEPSFSVIQFRSSPFVTN